MRINRLASKEEAADWPHTHTHTREMVGGTLRFTATESAASPDVPESCQGAEVVGGTWC